MPTVEQVALVIASCREAGVPFKATAGLHHPVRRGERARLPQPARRHDGATPAGSRRCSPRRTRRALDVADADRALFAGFGSCSWREPVDDLRELGLLS